MQAHLIFRPLGESYKVTISNTATSLPSIPVGTIRAKIQVETADLRIKFNKTNSVTYGVTAGVGGGFLLPINTVANPWYTIEGRDHIDRARLYRGGSTDGYVNIIYEGEQETPSYNGGLA